MVLCLINGIVAGQAFLVTADEAYIIAKDWKSSSARVTDLRRIVADGENCMLADEVRALAVVPSHVAPNRKP